jgi:hypothetical protein
MNTIIFTENGSALKVDIDYKGAVLASYTYFLWESDSNDIIDEQSGNNLNSQDNRYDLPNPVNDNNGRFIQVLSVLKNPTDDKLKCAPLIKVFQGNRHQERHQVHEGATVSLTR